MKGEMSFKWRCPYCGADNHTDLGDHEDLTHADVTEDECCVCECLVALADEEA